MFVFLSAANEPSNNGNANIYSDGSVYFYPAVEYTSSCLMNMQRFPFDDQNCTLRFSSWTYSDDQLTLGFYDNISVIDLSFYEPNSDWDVISTGVNRNWNYDGGFYYDMTFWFVIRRRPGFYVYILIVPSLLLSIMAPGLFCIPPTRPDRTTLGKLRWQESF